MTTRCLAIALAVLPFLAASCKTTPAPRAGDKAPPFTATLDNGQTATLDSLMGPKGVVLYFYPKDETPGCTTEACTFQAKLADFEKMGYTIVGVSEDTPQKHQAFRSAHNLTFRLVSDTDRSIAREYNVPIATSAEGTTGFERTTFVISKDGIVRRRFTVPGPEEHVNLSYHALSEPF